MYVDVERLVAVGDALNRILEVKKKSVGAFLVNRAFAADFFPKGMVKLYIFVCDDVLKCVSCFFSPVVIF